MYNAANSIDNANEGIVMMDFFTVMGPWMNKYLEITAEVPAALLDQIKTYAAERYNEFTASATAEQQAAHWEWSAKMHDLQSSEFRDGQTAMY